MRRRRHINSWLPSAHRMEKLQMGPIQQGPAALCWAQWRINNPIMRTPAVRHGSGWNSEQNMFNNAANDFQNVLAKARSAPLNHASPWFKTFSGSWLRAGQDLLHMQSALGGGEVWQFQSWDSGVTHALIYLPHIGQHTWFPRLYMRANLIIPHRVWRSLN